MECRRIRIHRQQQHRARWRVRRIDTSRRRDNAEVVLHDTCDATGIRPRRDDSNGLVGDGLFAIGGLHEAALRLRHDLRGDREDIAVPERTSEGTDDGGEVVSRQDLGNTLDRPHPQFAEHGHQRSSFGSTSRANTSIHSR